MDNGYGIEAPPEHHHPARRTPVRFLIVIESGRTTLARLFLDNHEQVAEVDAGSEEVAEMIRGKRSEKDAQLPEWDRALAGHSAAERAAADVYRFDV